MGFGDTSIDQVRAWCAGLAAGKAPAAVAAMVDPLGAKTGHELVRRCATYLLSLVREWYPAPRTEDVQGLIGALDRISHGRYRSAIARLER